MDETGDFFLEGEDELVTIRGFKGILCLDLFGISFVVFGGNEGVDSVLTTHYVGGSGLVIIVGGEDGRWRVSEFHDLTDGCCR